MHNHLNKTKESPAYSISNILLVVVLYKHQFESSAAYLSLNNVLSALGDNIIIDVFIYDNSPTPHFDINTQFKNWKIEYVHDPENAGISKAYNQGALYAKKLSKEWLLLVDQDSAFPANALQTYVDAININTDIHLFAPILKTRTGIIVSPVVFKFHRGFSPSDISPGLHTFKCYSPVNSGICISLKLFNLTGGYNNAIKLDYSDFYFINKVKALIKHFVVINMVIEHSLSSFETYSYEAVIIRFKYLCEGALLSCTTIKEKLQASLVIIIRAAKLTFKYKSLYFFKIALNAIIFRKFR